MLRAVIREDKLDEESEKLSKSTGIPKEDIKVVMTAYLAEKHNNKRQPPVPAPEGGISLRAAARKYRMDNGTLSRWVQKGYIPILLRTKNEVYIDEDKVAEVIKLYKTAPGQGKKTVSQTMSNDT